jgi:hypothetical protein
MGSDPRRLDGLRPDEQVAAHLVERATGATARAHDVGRRQGAYDVHLTFPGGRTAALEVTTHAGPSARRGTDLLPRHRLHRSRQGRGGRPPLGSDPVLDGLPDAVSHLLLEGPVARRAAKVATAPGVDERHLFVGLGEGGLPDDLYHRLAAPLGDLELGDPDVPDGLTHLWLATGVPGSRLLGWDRATGWHVHPV